MLHLTRTFATRMASLLAAVGLGLTTLPATGWAAPMALERPVTLYGVPTLAPLLYQNASGDFTLTLLEAIGSMLDQLSAYQEAIASEASLPTACELPC
jgi:hypothetical protein